MWYTRLVWLANFCKCNSVITFILPSIETILLSLHTCVHENAYMEFSITDLSATITSRLCKFSIEVENNLIYKVNQFKRKSTSSLYAYIYLHKCLTLLAYMKLSIKIANLNSEIVMLILVVYDLNDSGREFKPLHVYFYLVLSKFYSF